MNEFTLQDDFSITRDSDGNVVANYDRDKDEIIFAHYAYEKNHGKEVKELIATFKTGDAKPPAATPPPAPTEDSKEVPVNENPNFHATPPTPDRPEVQIPSVEPEPHPQLANYTDDHLLYDLEALSESDFKEKWGGKMQRSTLNKLRNNPRKFGDHATAITELIG